MTWGGSNSEISQIVAILLYILSSSEVLESCNNGYGNYGGEIPLTVLVELIIDE